MPRLSDEEPPLDEDDLDPEDPDADEPRDCGYCSGTGEGLAHGSICPVCKGRGVIE